MKLNMKRLYIFKNTSNKIVSIKLLINKIELYHNMNKNLGNIPEKLKKNVVI